MADSIHSLYPGYDDRYVRCSFPFHFRFVLVYYRTLLFYDMCLFLTGIHSLDFDVAPYLENPMSEVSFVDLDSDYIYE